MLAGISLPDIVKAMRITKYTIVAIIKKDAYVFPNPPTLFEANVLCFLKANCHNHAAIRIFSTVTEYGLISEQVELK